MNKYLTFLQRAAAVDEWHFVENLEFQVCQDHAVPALSGQG